MSKTEYREESGDKGIVEACYRQVIRNLTGILGSLGGTFGALKRSKDNARLLRLRQSKGIQVYYKAGQGAACRSWN